MSTYIGIDPGKKGAMAIFNDIGRLEIHEFSTSVFKSILMPFFDPFSDEKEAKCCLEHVSAMPGNGSVSMFNFGENFGFIQGLLTAYEIPYELVRPQKWKKEFGISSDKNQSVEVCRRLFPNAILKRSERCTKMDDGFAEALLLAEYCRRHFGGEA